MERGPQDQITGKNFSGKAEDYITSFLGIPAILAEIGHSSEFIGDWITNSKETAFGLMKDNQVWVDYIFT